jgi:predicted DNA-binding protein YlxM (UPF0122 family)
MPIKKKITPAKRGRPVKDTKPIKLVENVDTSIEQPHSITDLPSILKMRYKNKLSLKEIADHYNTSPQAIQQKIQRFMNKIDDPEILQSFDDLKPEILSTVERTLIQNIVDIDKLKKANLNNVAYAFTQIHQANRLEKGQATAINDDVDSILQRIDNRFNKAIDVTPPK